MKKTITRDITIEVNNWYVCRNHTEDQAYLRHQDKVIFLPPADLSEEFIEAYRECVKFQTVELKTETMVRSNERDL